MPLYAQNALIPNPGSGQYFHPVSQATAGTNGNHGTGTLRVSPWLVTRPLTIDRLGAEVTTVGDAGSKVRLGIYGDTGNAYPGALLLDAGQIAGDSATVQQLTVSLVMTPGLYWIGGVVQTVTTTQPTVRTTTSWVPPVVIPLGTTLPTSNVSVIGLFQTSVTGALPSTFSTTVNTINSVIRTFVRVV